MAAVGSNRSSTAGKVVVVGKNPCSKFALDFCTELTRELRPIVFITPPIEAVRERVSQATLLDDVIWQSLQADSDDIEAQIRSLGNDDGGIRAFVYLGEEIPATSLETTDKTQWNSLLNSIQIMFAYYRATARVMARAKAGSMVGVDFGVNARGEANLLTWSVLGDALVGLSKCVALELLPQGVRVNTVGYGYMSGVAYPESSMPVMQQYFEYLGVPRHGTARDVCNLVRLLVSEEGSYITGQSLFVNGGLLM